MKRLFLAAALCASLATVTHAGSLIRSPRRIPGQYIVMLAANVGNPAQVADDFAKAQRASIRHVYGYGTPGFAFAGPESAALGLLNDPRVAYIEENAQGDLLQVAPISPPGWGLDRQNQLSLALDHFGGPDCVVGTNIRIYIIDTGINDPAGTEFGSRLVNLYRCPTCADFADHFGHGSSVASIAAGRTYGLARAATVMNLRIVDPTGHWSIDDAMAAIDAVNSDHASAGNHAGVVNMSIISPPGSAALDAKILASINGNGAGVNAYGLTYVVGAGNGQAGVALDACTAGSPARLGRPNNPPYNPNSYSTITVGATMLRGPSEDPYRHWDIDERANRPEEINPWTSNIGRCVDLFAAGSNVDSLDGMSASGGLIPFSGTSSAAPYVTGEVARELSVYTTLTSTDIELQLKNSASPEKITDVGTDSPNLLLRTGAFRCRPGFDPVPLF